MWQISTASKACIPPAADQQQHQQETLGSTTDMNPRLSHVIKVSLLKTADCAAELLPASNTLATSNHVSLPDVPYWSTAH